MNVVVDYDKNLMFFKQLTTKELEWLETNFTWYNRAGALKDLVKGDFVQEQDSKKVGVYIESTGAKTLSYKLLNGVEKDTAMWDVIRVEKETLLYKNKQGVYYTLYGLKSLIEQKSPFKVEEQNPKPRKYVKTPVDPNVLQGITLADYQCAAIQKALMLQKGLETIPTGGGKTEIMLAIIHYLMQAAEPADRTIVVVPTVLLAQQFKSRALSRGYDKNSIGIITGSLKEYDAKILVFTMASLVLALRAKKLEVMKILMACKHLLIDETHHLRCDSMVEILKGLPPLETMLGFSGSPFLIKNPLVEAGDCLMWGLTGGPIFDVPYEYLVKIGFIARPIVHMKKIEGKNLKYRGNFQKIYEQFLMKNQTRTDYTVKAAKRAVEMGFKVLILVQRLAHADKIMQGLSDQKVISVFGGSTSVDFDDQGETRVSKINYDDFREDFENGGYDIAIGSTVADEGMDLPSVGFVIMAGGGKSRIKVLQRLGRGLRKKKVGQNVVYLLDFIDRGHVYLSSQSRKRLELYKEASADVAEEEILFWQKMHIHAKQLKEGTPNGKSETNKKST